MQIKIKVFLLLLLVGAGLLLGGNTRADGSQIQSSDTQSISAQIESIRQKISELTAQAQQPNIVAQNAAVSSVQLTPAQLNYIASEVNRIAQKTAQLKIEVEIFVVLREIERKTNLLRDQIAATNRIYGTPVPATIANPLASTIPTEPKNQGIEIQIGKIRQQIAELNQELAIQKSIEMSQASRIESEQCALDGTCSINSTAAGETAPVAATGQSVLPKTTETKTERGGFWQSVGNFLKKIFTF